MMAVSRNTSSSWNQIESIHLKDPRDLRSQLDGTPASCYHKSRSDVPDTLKAAAKENTRLEQNLSYRWACKIQLRQLAVVHLVDAYFRV
jgi:hypothetical protein